MKKPVIQNQRRAPPARNITIMPGYIFGSMKAAMTNPHTKKRVLAKLPTSLAELARLKKL